jgi:hypothetical protein
MWGYFIGICIMVGDTQECQDQTFVPGFSSQTACEVHAVLQTTIINYDLFHIDHVYDTWVSPTNCVDMSDSTSEFFKELD